MMMWRKGMWKGMRMTRSFDILTTSFLLASVFVVVPALAYASASFLSKNLPVSLAHRTCASLAGDLLPFSFPFSRRRSQGISLSKTARDAKSVSCFHYDDALDSLQIHTMSSSKRRRRRRNQTRTTGAHTATQKGARM